MLPQHVPPSWGKREAVDDALEISFRYAWAVAAGISGDAEYVRGVFKVEHGIRLAERIVRAHEPGLCCDWDTLQRNRGGARGRVHGARVVLLHPISQGQGLVVGNDGDADLKQPSSTSKGGK